MPSSEQSIETPTLHLSRRDIEEFTRFANELAQFMSVTVDCDGQEQPINEFKPQADITTLILVLTANEGLFWKPKSDNDDSTFGLALANSSKLSNRLFALQAENFKVPFERLNGLIAQRLHP